MEDGALDALDYLMTLDFSDNRLTSPPKIANVCDTLIQLLLRNNTIRIIPDFYFSGCRELKNLDIEQNRISMLNENSLRGLTKINELSFGSNYIRDVACGAFQDMISLKKLSFTNNYLRDMPCFEQSHPNMKLEVLDLSDNNLKIIKEEEVLPLVHLQEINLGYNQLPNLDFISGIPSLSKIRVFDNYNTKINPSTFEKSLNITYLSFKESELNAFPILGPSKKTIREIYIDSNKVTCIDIEHVSGMTELRRFLLSYGDIKRFPDPGCLVYFNESKDTLNNISFPQLMNIDISFNKLTQFPWLPDMPDNSEIDLDHNKISSFPPERLGFLRRVRKLLVSYNWAYEFPDFSQLPPSNKLTYLTLSHNGIKHMDHSHIVMLQQLRQLTLDNNKIPVLPDMTFASGSLVNFPLHHNRLTDLNPVITTDGSLWSITYWPVNDNKLMNITKELLEQMAKLRVLRAENNFLTVLPFLTAVGSSLQEADFRNNRIEQIPEENLQRMTKLKFLDLAENKISSFPFRVLLKIPDLRQLLLQENLLLGMEDLSWYSPLPSFVLNITVNPLNCTPELCWLRQFTGFNILKDLYLCVEPPLDAILFDDITDVQMNCFGE